MSDTSNDDLRETETQMRRVLGLNHQPTPGHEPPPRTTTGVGAAHPHRRRFVRDGDVPVTVVHREHDQGAGTNKLDAAQEALHEQMAAREQTEQLLQEARATIRALETKLAHERIAREEAVLRLEEERQAILDELATERAARQQADQERDEAIAARQEAPERLCALMAGQDAQTTSAAPTKAKRGRSAGPAAIRPDEEPPAIKRSVPAMKMLDGTSAPKVARRRGRPPKVQETDTEFVEWWKPGWRERHR